MFKIMNHQSSPRMNNINNLDTKEAILCEADDIYDSDPGYLTDGSSQLHGNTDKDHSLMSATKGNSTEEDTERKRVTANSQERCRMQRLNHALDSLRRCLPHQLQVCHRRLSKIRTLKLAANYISTLAEILNEHCASKYRLAQRRVLGMDPRFVNRTDVHRKDADVFRSGKHQHMSRSSESQRRTPAACQYAYHDGVSGASETTDIGSPDLSTTLQHHPVSVYHEMVNERQSIPYYNVSKDGFGQVFGHPTSPWYHKGVLVTGSSSAAIQQL